MLYFYFFSKEYIRNHNNAFYTEFKKQNKPLNLVLKLNSTLVNDCDVED